MNWSSFLFNQTLSLEMVCPAKSLSATCQITSTAHS